MAATHRAALPQGTARISHAPAAIDMASPAVLVSTGHIPCDQKPGIITEQDSKTANTSAAGRTRVSIIGTAGRLGNAARLTHTLYSAMITTATRVIETDLGLAPAHVCLVSGGAAWADHVAVSLFLADRGYALELCLPCPWVPGPAISGRGGPGHLERVTGDWRTNPGAAANKYHRTFSDKLGRSSLAEIETARMRGAAIRATFKGFHARNTAVAQCDYLIAFTFDSGDAPLGGGTLDTWRKAAGAHKVHVSLSELGETGGPAAKRRKE
eukprot:m.63119 g.63119  ORF g.63119 m.63119 type:complete len:269 (-) comp7176_c0_seq1:2813-3619(-)